MTAPVPVATASSEGFEIEPAGRLEWLLLALGVALRLLLQFPLHRYPGDGDCVLTALQGVQVFHGDPAVFVPSGYRLGALNAYVTAAWDAVFGVGRMALAMGVFTVGSTQMLLWWLATRELVGSRLARIALPFIVLPSPAVLEWGLHLPNANPEIFLASTAVVWLGARLHRRGGGVAAFFLFGLASGIAFWASLLTLGVSIPTAIWVARERARASFLRAAAATAAGALAGASPWLAFNVRYGWQSLTESRATEAVDDWPTFLESLRNLWQDRIVHLFAGAEGLGNHAMPATMPRLALWIAAATFSIAILGGSVLAAIRRGRGARTPRESSVLALAFAVFAFLALLNLASRISLLPGNTVRYLLPAAIPFPWLFALAWKRATHPRQGALATLAAAALLLHASASCWPWRDFRTQMRRELAENRKLARALVGQGVDAVYGSYWIVYPLILDSDLALTGVPLDPHTDFLRQRDRALPDPARWAIVANRRRIAALPNGFDQALIETGSFGAIVLAEGVEPSGIADELALKGWYPVPERTDRLTTASE